MADREVGVGVIGYGLGGRVFHAPFVSAVPGLKLISIMQRTGDAAAKAYPEIKIERSIDATLADKSVEVVVVSTPNETENNRLPWSKTRACQIPDVGSTN